MKTLRLEANWDCIEQFCEEHGLAYRVDRSREVLVDTFTGEVAASTPRQAMELLK
jgi:hypothetical protein